MIDDPTTASLARNAAEGYHLLIPWTRQPLNLADGFDSRRIMTSPWASQSPFNRGDLRRCKLVYNSDDDCHATFRDAISTADSQSSEHQSGSLGISVGIPFLSGSASCSFDKDVHNNTDSNKVSQNCSFRAGAVKLSDQPGLTVRAREYLKQKDGEALFRDAFGDYYVDAFQIGADTGTFLSVNSDYSSTYTQVTVSVTIKVLFWSATVSHTDEHFDEVAHLNFNYSAYDTLDNLHDSMTSSDSDGLQRILKANVVYQAMAADLGNRVEQRLRQIKLSDVSELAFDQCARLATSGLVAQVVLKPFRTLREYQLLIRK